MALNRTEATQALACGSYASTPDAIFSIPIATRKEAAKSVAAAKRAHAAAARETGTAAIALANDAGTTLLMAVDGAGHLPTALEVVADLTREAR